MVEVGSTLRARFNSCIADIESPPSVKRLSLVSMAFCAKANTCGNFCFNRIFRPVKDQHLVLLAVGLAAWLSLRHLFLRSY